MMFQEIILCLLCLFVAPLFVAQRLLKRLTQDESPMKPRHQVC